MHCFVPPQPVLVSLQHSRKRRRPVSSSSVRSNDSLASSVGCSMSNSSSASSLTTCASMKTIKKNVRFAGKETDEVHMIANRRKFKHPERIWWQLGELPMGGCILRSLLAPDKPYTVFNISTPHDEAKRIVRASYTVLEQQAKRGGGCQSLRAQMAAARDYQASMGRAPAWRGLEALLMTSGSASHTRAVVDAQHKGESLLDAARTGSRPAAQLALERARFDARQVGQTV